MTRRIVWTVVGLVVGLIAALLVYAATRPDTFAVERRVVVRAPLAKIHPLIDDLRLFNTWNPFIRKDPAIKGSYRGPASGPGAGYDFTGNGDVGQGSIEVVEPASPTLVTMKLDMIEPFEGHNIVEFKLRPEGDATEVTWAMHGPSPFLARLAGLVFDMDRMIGTDFDAGLAELKRLAERP